MAADLSQLFNNETTTTTKQFTKSYHQPSLNLLKRRVKEIPRGFGFDLGRLVHAWIIFEPIGKSLRNGKKTSTSLKKVLRNYALS